jgi:hypothetical protein
MLTVQARQWPYRRSLGGSGCVLPFGRNLEVAVSKFSFFHIWTPLLEVESSVMILCRGPQLQQYFFFDRL